MLQLAHHTYHCYLQVSNFGSSFAIKPWNYFNELPSRVVYDVSEPQQCTPVDVGLDFPWPPPGS